MVRMIARVAAVAVFAAAALAPSMARASLIEGLSIRAGINIPSSGQSTVVVAGGGGGTSDAPGLRNVVDFGAWGGGLEYQLKGVPSLFNGEGWSTSISADFHYSQRKAGIVRVIPVSINQVCAIEGSGNCKPYAGFCLTAATISGDGLSNTTRWGGGLILGSNCTEKLYLEGRYEWIDCTGGVPDASGFRTYLGYRF
ncbi:MAG: hypothetical protein NT029_16180 [Armatimonadetes bacterium]|nr:hypothetical protein [Armatimonadota bacterium]